MVASGTLALDRIAPHTFALEDVGAALDAAQQTHPFQQVVIRP